MVLNDVIFFTIAPLRLAVGVSDTFSVGALTITLDTTGTVGCALLLLARGVGDCFTTTVDLIEGADVIDGGDLINGADLVDGADLINGVDLVDGADLTISDFGILTVDATDGNFNWKLLKLKPFDEEVVVAVVGLISSIFDLEIATGDGFTSDLL